MGLNILGAAVAYPEQEITNDFLAELGFAQEAEAVSSTHGINGRRTSLSLDYIKDTRNVDTWHAHKNCTQMPAQLGAHAVSEALACAGIEQSELGLIIADCAVPIETCPSEAQRIAKELGIKVPAFDVTAGGATLTMHLDSLARWMNGSCPKYVASVSVATMTHAVDYRKGIDAAFWGDAASAVIVSMEHPGAYEVSDYSYRVSAKPGSNFGIAPYSHLFCDYPAVIEQSLAKHLSDSRFKDLACAMNWTQDRLMPPQFSQELIDQVCAELSVPRDAALFEVSSFGHCGGASTGAALANLFKNRATGANLLVSEVGPGMAWGYIRLGALKTR